jgi:aspartyl-tRNA(Asn)/glutamyl-tRNA(Gln) amidotransferase subunit A
VKIQNDEHLAIAKIAPWIRKRRISPVELTKAFLDRIERLQPETNAYLTVTGEMALRQAREAEREIVKGKYRGVLHGIPISLKDLFYTRGIRTTGGSKILKNFVPKENAAVVDLLLEQGIVLLGKTNLHEFAFGCTNVNPHYGPVRNPWNPERMSGGSSGGSAATVVSAMAMASLGTDTGGSVRIPAGACGCVGLKPTYGRTSLRGVIPLATSLDHVGPLTRSVEDAALVLEVIAGPEKFSKDLRKGVKAFTIGVPKQYFFDRLQPAVRRAVLDAIGVLEELGGKTREVRLEMMKETARLAGEITVAEAVAYHWRWLQKRAADYGADLSERMLANANMLSVTYLKAQELRARYRELFIEALNGVDVMVAPTLPVVAPRIEEEWVMRGRSKEDVRLALLSLTRPGNLTGLPAISVPCGFSSDGLPIGLQLTAKPFQESFLLRAAYAFEHATPWHLSFPR